jgi:WD40 repeat protein
MAQSSRTFRIFVSSTFSDLKEERNALQEKVFPSLRDLASTHGCRFQAIDLRWGVSEEAALDQQTMKICLGEIERCQKTSPRPNFIVLLGDRYGWRPLPAEIPADEFEKIIAKVTKDEKVLLEKWYRRDDNALPPVYCLQARSGETVEYASWEIVETRLRQIFLKAIEKLSLSSDETLKYTASATEQEIVAGALKVPDAKDHVFCFFREINGLPKDETSRDFHDADTESSRMQAELKERLKKGLAGNVHEYSAQWQKTHPSLDHLEQLCEDVYAELSKVILAETGKLEKVDSLDAEITAHETFGKDRAHVFIGRADILNAIEKYIAGNDPHPLAVWGASGSGKSALMAKAVEQAQKNGQDVLYRFIGATPESSNGRALLESLCRQISHCYGADEATIPSEYKDLVQEFPKRLALATSDKPLIIFLDALDQLSDTDNARGLAWLPAELPPNVRLIVSTLPGECLKAMEAKSPRQKQKRGGWLHSIFNRQRDITWTDREYYHYLLEIQPMSIEEGKNILTEWLSGVNRQLEEKQEEHLLGKFQQCALPLYFKLAFEEAKLWKSYNALPGLGNDIPSILRDLFKRLSKESNHGEMLVSRSLGYLAAARNGLSEDELLDVLSADQEVQTDFQRRSPKSPKSDRLPVVIWSRLYSDLKSYLALRTADGTALISFYHRQMGEVVMDDFLAEDKMQNRHRVLAQYFGSQGLQTEQENKQIPNLRKLSEQLYQQTQARMGPELENTLTDLKFIEAKCTAGMIHDLMDEYNAVFRSNILTRSGRDSTEEFARFIRSRSHILKFHPNMVIQEAINFTTSGPIFNHVDRILNDPHHPRTPWLRLVNQPKESTIACLQTLVGHAGWVNAVAIVGLDGLQALTGGHDRAVKLWNLDNGKCIRTFDGHVGPIRAVVVTSDGSLAVSGSHDKTIKVWELATGICLKTLQGHTDWVHAVAITADGSWVVTGSLDKTARVWNLATGKCLRKLKHRYGVSAVAVTPDDRYLFTGMAYTGNNPVQMWDIRTGKCLLKMEGHGHWVEAMAVTPDGNRIVTGSRDRTIRVWSIQTGVCLQVLKGHRDYVLAIAVSSDGTLVVSASADQTIKIWDLDKGVCLRTFSGHMWDILSVAITPDGSRLVSGSWDDTARVWDLTLDTQQPAVERHTGQASVAVTSDSRRAITGSIDETIKIWDIQTGECLRTLEQKVAIDAIALTPDNQSVITSSWNSVYTGNSINLFKEVVMVGVIDLHTGNCIQKIVNPTSRTKVIALTPDGHHLLIGGDDRMVKIWNLKSGSCLQTLQHPDQVGALAVSPDNRLAVSGSADRTIQVWELDTGHLVYSLEGYHSCWTSVIFTPDGRQIVSCVLEAKDTKGDGIKLLNPDTGSLIQSITGHTDSIRTLAVSPDGRHVISGSDDKAIRVWDLTRAEEVACFFAEDSICGLAVSPDGTRIVGVGDKGGVYFLSLENVVAAPSFVTVWGYGEDMSPVFGCPHCHTWSDISKSALGSEIPCPNCGKHVRLNPFTIKGDWKPIAKAWQKSENKA